ncbi:hypothetical protein DEU56DRAFT_812649 [Suillus clintonianus]|uniref:uncharacterized protein n=1 Tax=Suillus clintonianus TaxID=1904413 RepID=UPI001B883C20|nr:uncharacterized protein DEU56DRAFT_812649 [Suillus clintonianus]KAG2132395.1 hypothetical protein DEU56DRAFT_812649 [Suillus clintonianus]
MDPHPRQPPPRLSIPPMMTMQQPFDGRQPMFSPALPTALQHSFHPPPYYMNGPPLQTPMQSFFPHQPPPAPARPTYVNHKGHASIAHFPGYPPPSAIPMTPLGSAFPSQMGPPFGQPFIPRNRRAPSISIGGPPKAPLGGPGRKHSPLPPPQAAATPAPKGKKVVVNIPVETISGDAGEPSTRPSWARTPVAAMNLEEPEVIAPEIASIELYPPDSWRRDIPDTVDVFLPGQAAWDAIKLSVIEEKLVRLGVERGSGGIVPIHAPHARAASISSPADPSLLHFKLNKLQQAQTVSSLNSLSNSPQPLNISPSPHQLPPRFQNRHGHSLSLAHPPLHENFYIPSAAFNPFGPSAVLGSDSIEINAPTEPFRAPIEGIHAPQGRVPVSVPSLIPPGVSRASSRPDFTRGFGLDIPEEEEPSEEEVPVDMDDNALIDLEGPDGQDSGRDATTVALSRLHSRHVSRLSAALSLRSVGGIAEGAMSEVNMVPIRSPIGNPGIDDLDKEAVGEWTGSEDMHADKEQSDDEESIGEWSNPSDEERARQNRVQRRILRQMKHEAEKPRRLPNFPIPPRGGLGMSLRSDFDIVSNPSEEDNRGEIHTAFLGVDPADFPVRPLSASTTGRRPLPPVPHSRGQSGQYSVHDPALAHSRNISEQLDGNNEGPAPIQSSSFGALNPHAKPFVFGAARQSGSWSIEAAPLKVPVLSHTRIPSLGKPLNAAAQEFKPTGFTFRPPPGVPRLAFPASEPSRPLPVPPIKPSSVRAQQGREKRQRRGSRSSFDEDEDDSGKENMASFRFPALGETPRSRRSAPTSPWTLGSRDFNSSAGPLQPLTFSGFSTLALPDEDGVQEIEIAQVAGDFESPQNDDFLGISNTFPSIAPTRPKRAPIPLDFKNPTPSNTLPAGVFKALVGDEKTRRTVRSRLSSREIFEHSQRPSLDDLAAPAISMLQQRSQSRLVTDPGLHRHPLQSPDIFTPAIKRRSSLPALHSAHNSHHSELSNVSIPALNLTKRLETQALEDKIEALLTEKFQALHTEIARARTSAGASSISPTTEDMITEVVGLFRTQLQESAARGLDESQMDARGELDLAVIRDVVQRGHAEGLLMIQTELRGLVDRLEEAGPTESTTDVVAALEQLNKKNMQVILNTIDQLSSQIGQYSRPFADGDERLSLVTDIMAALTPTFTALRPDPVDYNVLTAQLSQAVKPNIEQLIDLAADKRETAGLIVDSIIPLLPKVSLDTNEVIAQITAEVRRVIAPIDAHEIKEQVADLVVERLDSRLAVRDKAFNVEIVSGKVTEGVSDLLHSFNDVVPKLDALGEAQQLMSKKSDEITLKHTDLHAVVASLPTQLDDLKCAMQLSSQELQARASSQSNEEVLTAISQLEFAINSLASTHLAPSTQNEELFSMYKSLREDLSERMNALPEALHAAVSVLQTAHAEFAVSRDASKRDQEEIRRLKTAHAEHQVQVAKARGAHGQIRVEKENLAERFKDVESERDRLRAQVEELQSAIKTHSANVAAVESRNSELEEALSQSLARLKASDVTTQANQERIGELEKANQEALTEQANLNFKVGELNTSVKFMTDEKDLAVHSLQLLQKEHEHLLSQQSHWDDLHRAAEQIDMLTTLMNQSGNEELKELRRAREQSRILESEHAALQKRFREQELKISNAERTANAARQNLAQAQHRASEWENRAKEYEGDLEMTRTRLDEVEQAHAQLDADHSFAKLQLEEKEAEDRLVKDREQKLRDQVANFEAQVARLETDLSKTKATPVPSMVSSYIKLGQTESPPRPDSRSSTVFSGDRSSTPVAQINGSHLPRSDTPPQSSPSVRDSMHAPRRYPQFGPGVPATPQPRRPIGSYRPQSVVSFASSHYASRSVASPTPSTVSIIPDDEGWYS